MVTRLGRVVAVAGLVAIAGPARASGAPCLDDAARLCPNEPPGPGAVWDCLMRHQLEVSGACTRNMQDVRRRAAEFSADCAGDVYRFCPRVQPGAGRVLSCLAVHAGRRELSTTCEAAVAGALEKARAFQEGCAQDAALLCQGVQPGGGHLLGCLRSQEERLSTRCRRAVNPK